jgi:hypothetical protein
MARGDTCVVKHQIIMSIIFVQSVPFGKGALMKCKAVPTSGNNVPSVPGFPLMQDSLSGLNSVREGTPAEYVWAIEPQI